MLERTVILQLAKQHLAADSERGVLTALVPDFEWLTFSNQTYLEYDVIKLAWRSSIHYGLKQKWQTRDTCYRETILQEKKAKPNLVSLGSKLWMLISEFKTTFPGIAQQAVTEKERQPMNNSEEQSYTDKGWTQERKEK